MPVLCKALRDVSYQNDKIETSFVAPFEQLGLVPASARQDLSHLLRGRHRATGFELLYADLWQRRGGRGSRNSSSASVFHGLLFRIEVPATIPIHVVVKPRPYGVPAAFGRLFEAPTIARLTEVDLGTGEFATKFEVRAAMRDATDADGVRALISPQLQRAFLDLNEREGALIGNRAAFSAAFLEDSFYLALSRYGQSSIAGIAFERPRPFLDAGLYLLGDEGELETRLLRVLDDAHIAYRIIDRLHQTE